jgi:hypothetical protein
LLDDAQGCHTYEAMALIDPIQVNEEALIQDQDSPTRHLLQPSYRDNDGVSVLSGPADTFPGAKHHRRISSTLSNATASSVTGTVSSTPSKSSAPKHQKTKSEISTGSSSIHSTTSDREGQQTGSSEVNTTGAGTGGRHGRNASSSGSIRGGTKNDSKQSKSSEKRQKAKELSKSKARLLFSTQHDNIPNDTPPHGQTTSHALALLDFRPLCPCVAKWAVSSSSKEQGEETMAGVFVGSADDSLLRFYVPCGSPSSLVTKALPEEHFAVDTAVMALDFCAVPWQEDNGDAYAATASPPSTLTMYVLALACQDGTIQLISWEKGNDKTLFTNISSHKVIVDGPLVCVRLHYSSSTSLRVIIGSLSGYVCQLIYNRDKATSDSAPAWLGPFIVCQGLWNDHLDGEDSVLSLDVCDNYVAVGTQAGRCILYATRDDNQCVPMWYALLPYSVHGVRILQNSGLSSNPGKNVGMLLSVTTRRSFHLFQALRGRVDVDPMLLKTTTTCKNFDEDDGLPSSQGGEVGDTNGKEVGENMVEDAKVERNTQATDEGLFAKSQDNKAAAAATDSIDVTLDGVDWHSTAKREYAMVSEESTHQQPAPAVTAPPQLEYSSSEDDDEALSNTDDALLSTTDENRDASRANEDLEDGLEPLYQQEIILDDDAVFVGVVSEIAHTVSSSEEFGVVKAPPEEDAKD